MHKNISIALGALALGLAIGYGVSIGFPGDVPDKAADTNVREILYYEAPMDKNFRRDKPGQSPMGMDLVPVYADEQGMDADALWINAAVENNIGVRTDRAIRADLAREVSTVGFIAIDEELSTHVHVRTSGWIEKLHRKTVGESVRKGELIFSLYSPDLVNAQAEYIQAIRLKQISLKNASAERLKSLGMMDSQIKEVEASGKVKQLIEIRAPQDGVITALMVGEGMFISPSETVFSLADLTEVWVQVEVFEGQSDWVKKGQMARMTLPFLPGESWSGTVDYVYPIVDPVSRTVQVRLSFENARGRLKPNMYGEISIDAAPALDVVSIPREALIRTGKTDRVVLALGGGRYRPAEVVAGRETGDRVEIKQGLSAGETVVVSGQFLLDSEASINGAFLRLMNAGPDEGDPMNGMSTSQPTEDAQRGQQ